MKLYLTAIAIALAATITLVNACVFHSTSSRTVPFIV